MSVVTRAGDISGASSVDYATSDTAGVNCGTTNGAASSRCDYLTTLGTLHFLPNEASRTISIPIVDDSYAEGNESFTFTLRQSQRRHSGFSSGRDYNHTPTTKRSTDKPIDRRVSLCGNTILIF